MAWGKGNFLVRSRSRLADLGFTVVVVDAPSDRRAGMNAIFRMGEAHARDIEAVVAHMRKAAALPVWLVGTSMGTFSAAGVAIRAKGIDGIVLTSSITRAKPNWKIRESHPTGVASIPLQLFRGPALIISHEKDACELTPAADAEKLKRALSASRKVSVVLIEGGLPPRSDACAAFSQHGFLGVEDKALAAIAKFVEENSRTPAPAQ
jgi:pimeloyl-ACP methyl ester carboxylesterase